MGRAIEQKPATPPLTPSVWTCAPAGCTFLFPRVQQSKSARRVARRGRRRRCWDILRWCCGHLRDTRWVACCSLGPGWIDLGVARKRCIALSEHRILSGRINHAHGHIRYYVSDAEMKPLLQKLNAYKNVIWSKYQERDLCMQLELISLFCTLYDIADIKEGWIFFYIH